MQKQYPKQKHKKEPNSAIRRFFKPLVHQRVAFFAAAGNANSKFYFCIPIILFS